MPVPIQIGAAGLDLSGREGDTATVAASPAAAAETVIATFVLPTDVVVEHGVLLFGFAAWTVGTNGTAVTLKIRQTGTSGTTIKSTGAITSTAANLDARAIMGVDSSPALTGQTYVLTATVTGGSAQSTVSAVELIAIVI